MQTFVSMDHAEQGADDEAFHMVFEYLEASGIPPVRLTLKIGAPVMLIQSMNPVNGFCKQCPMYRKTHALPRVEQAAFRLPTDAYWGLLGLTRAS
jgi:hypothetical protein